MTDTIFAPATAAGRAAVAVIRVSGPDSSKILQTLAAPLPARRRAVLRRLVARGEILDEALVLWLPGPSSFTGEDSAELHLHGGRAGVEAVSRALADLGLRLAEPGEFSRRAFQNGKLDLTQAEAIADLVDAETDAQRRQALGQLEGELSARYEGWRKRLIQALARLEAAVDFPDEDLPETLQAEVGARIGDLAGELEAALADAGRGERIRDGLHIALIGPPNAGKSTLLNRLAGRDAAIVTPIAGTTRDIIEVPAVIDGFKVLFADMAGLRASADPIEQEGVRRALAWAETADCRLWVMDPTSPDPWSVPADMAHEGDVLIINKSDLLNAPIRLGDHDGISGVTLSAKNGEGMDQLWDLLQARVRWKTHGDFPAVTRLRHRRHLGDAAEALRRGQAALARSPELGAEDLRHAAQALGRIAGRIDPEQVLDEVFSSFCIGK
jgi:tRNA modification GTPase